MPNFFIAPFKIAALLPAAALALSACGTTVEPITYRAMDYSGSDTSTLGGVALQSNNSTSAYAVRTSSGSLTHPNGPLTIILSDGTSTVTLTEKLNGSATSGSASLLADGTQGFSIYDYVVAYEQAYSQGGTNYDLPIAIVGVITRSVDMPGSGSVSYSGEAIAQIIQETSGWTLSDGTSTTLANFSTGRVNVTLTGFTVTEAVGGSAVSPIDTITLTDMVISGSRFSGGTIVTRKTGSPVNVTGGSNSLTTAGAFFGQTSGGSTPDEVAGIVLLQGSSGTLTAAFIGD